MLKNPLFVGQVSHKGQVFEGEHDAIVGLDVWEQVQATLQKNRDRTSNGLRAKCPSLLGGKLFDDKGNRMSPTHSSKSGKRYRYYVSQAVIKDQKHQAGGVTRIPCVEIELLVRSEMQAFLCSDQRVHDALGNDSLLSMVAASAATRSAAAEKINSDNTLLRRWVRKVTVSRMDVTIELEASKLFEALQIEFCSTASKDLPTIEWTVNTELKRSGGETKLIISKAGDRAHDLRPALIKAVARGYAWNRELLRGESPSIRVVARKHGVDERQIRRHLPLALLAPDIIEAIVEGRAPAELTVHQLYRRLPLDWENQRKLLGFA